MIFNARKIFLSRIALHIYFWIAVFFSFSMLYFFPEIRMQGILKNLIYFPADIAFTYFFLYSLNTLITKKKKFLLFSVLFALSVLGYTLITYAIDQLIIPIVLGKSEYSQYNIHTFFHSSWVIVIIALAAGYIKMIRTWHRTDKENIRLDLEKSRAYNQLLRSKVNPHFLFNTLNNIQCLVEVDPPKASKSISELGDLMSYMVYEADSDFVSLQKEVNYIQDFIKLQSLRIVQEDFVDLHLEGDFEDARIASMLLIPFIENAFKYSDRGACPGISINIIYKEGTLDFQVVNKVAKKVQNGSKGGFGIENVRKRLELIYPGKYDLSIHRNGKFRIHLILRLS